MPDPKENFDMGKAIANIAKATYGGTAERATAGYMHEMIIDLDKVICKHESAYKKLLNKQ